MPKPALLDYISITAVQVATLPQGLWSLLATRTLPNAPTKDDTFQMGFHTALGGLIASGVSAFAQNLQAKGTVGALTGARLGLLEMNWSSVGAALVTGAAIGASVGIATYLSREGRRARQAANAMTSSSSPLNVDMSLIRDKGADPWAINRALESNPKAADLLRNAVLANVTQNTHSQNAAVDTHANIALAAAMMTNVGSFKPSVAQAKTQWVGKIREQMNDTPSAQLLLDTMPRLVGLRDGASSLDMHAAWSTMMAEQVERPNDNKFLASFAMWSENYFKTSPMTQGNLGQECLVKVNTLDNQQRQLVMQESNTTHALVASSLFGAHVAPAPILKKTNQDPELENTGLSL